MIRSVISWATSEFLLRAVSQNHQPAKPLPESTTRLGSCPCLTRLTCVAHCRRRKIRCVIADADPQQRCQNCIRLKKECVFYPVEQQNAMDIRGESSSKAVTDSGPSSAVSVSPPNNVTDRSFESTRDFPPFAALPSNASTTFQGLPFETGSALLSQGEFDYSAKVATRLTATL